MDKSANRIILLEILQQIARMYDLNYVEADTSMGDDITTRFTNYDLDFGIYIELTDDEIEISIGSKSIAWSKIPDFADPMIDPMEFALKIMDEPLERYGDAITRHYMQILTNKSKLHWFHLIQSQMANINIKYSFDCGYNLKHDKIKRLYEMLYYRNKPPIDYRAD